MFAEVLGALKQITDAVFAVYDMDPAEIAAMRRRFAAWRAELGQP